MDGLIHISELSWSHVNHPSEVLEIGQDVKVKVLDIDRERQRISLGLKQTQSDPWQQVLETYNEGDTVEGKVTKVVTFGAFVEIMPGVEGLVHISELAQHHVENPREVVSQGDLVEAKIIEVDAERRRLSLSLKRVEGGGVTQRADDSEPIEGTPDLDLSEEVFPEAQPLVGDSGPVEEASEEPGDSPGEAAAPEAAAVEEPPGDEPPAEESQLEEADASIEADEVAPDEPGPGDSEGEAPAPPE
jgi:small subunit ribosomal protein S1